MQEMLGKSAQYSVYIVATILALGYTMSGYGQGKGAEKSKQISSDYIQKAVHIPIIRNAMIDSVTTKLDILKRNTGKNFSFLNAWDSTHLKSITQLKSNFKALAISDLSTSAFLTKLPGLYSLKQSVSEMAKGTALISKINLTSQTVYDHFFITEKQYISNSALTFNSAVANVPLTFLFDYTYPSLTDLTSSSWFKMSFDKNLLLSSLNQQLNNKFDTRKLLLNDFNFKNIFQHYAESKILQIKSLLNGMEGNLRLSKGFDDLSVHEFLYLSKHQLVEKLYPTTLIDSLNMAKRNTLEQIASSTDTAAHKILSNKLEEIASSLAKINTIVNAILSTKSEFETSDLNYNQLVTYQNTINDNIDSISNSNVFTQDASKKLLKLKGLSRLFLYVQELNVGKFSTDWSDRSITGILSSGVGGSYIKNKKFLGVNFSSIQSLGWLKDNSFIANLQQPESAVQALRVGKGDLNSNHSHITLMNANIKNINARQTVYNLIPRNIFVGSFSKNLSLGTYGNVETEVSKSSTQHSNSRNFQNEDQLQTRLAFKHFGEDFFQSLSVGLKYNGDFESLHFKPSIFANFSGLGYNNPVSSNQSRGSIFYGVNTSNNFLSNKLFLYSRFSNRITQTGIDKTQAYKQLSSSVSAKYKLTRQFKFGVNWTYSNLLKHSGAHVKERLYYSNRIYSDVNFYGKIYGLMVMQYVNLGYQNISIPDMPLNTQGSTAWLNSSTSIAVGQNNLLFNLQMYNQLDRTISNGNLITSDLGLNYRVLKKINVTSSINFLNQRQLAKQIGIRQTVSAVIQDRFNVSLFADIRNDIISNANTFLFPNARGELLITYQIIK